MVGEGYIRHYSIPSFSKILAFCVTALNFKFSIKFIFNLANAGCKKEGDESIPQTYSIIDEFKGEYVQPFTGISTLKKNKQFPTFFVT